MNISTARGKSPFIKAMVLFLLIVAGGYGVVWVAANWFADGKRSGLQKLAIVRIEGVITKSDDIVRQLKKYGEDSAIKGVLLRVETPGGGVGAAQEIYKEVLRIKDKKKIVVSMGGLAASGGYYIACAAHKIVANPGTITGSIGVIMAFSNMEELFKKIGLKTIIIKSGRYKDIGVPTSELSTEGRRILQDVSDDIHNQFIEAVANGRDMKIEDVRVLADGRIFSGRQAMDAGLVDLLGNVEDAMNELASIAGIDGKPKIVEEKKGESLLYKILIGEAVSNLFSPGTGLFSGGAHYLWEGFRTPAIFTP